MRPDGVLFAPSGPDLAQQLRLLVNDAWIRFGELGAPADAQAPPLLDEPLRPSPADVHGGPEPAVAERGVAQALEELAQLLERLTDTDLQVRWPSEHGQWTLGDLVEDLLDRMRGDLPAALE